MIKTRKVILDVASLRSMGGSGISAIQVKSNTGSWQTIWNGSNVSPAPTIPIGANWEVRVLWNASSTTALWAISVTLVAPEAPSGRQKQSANVRYSTSGNYSDSADFNMGAMPSGNVSLRIKLWATDYYTVDPPADASPTAW